MEFSDYQKLALMTDRTGQDEDKSLMVTLLGLAGEAGSLLTEYKKWFRDGHAYRPFTDQVSEELGDILWYLANLASKLNLDLGEIAAENVAKNEDRWPKREAAGGESPTQPVRRYDSAYPAEEQLPLSLRIDFVEQPGPIGDALILRTNGIRIGDPLTDNSHIKDGYRYHDVFHIACAIILGWSPVMRRILKCKRKSVAATDVNEDGARALVTEEGVSAFVFGHALDYSMFEQSTGVYDVLSIVRGMTRAFEVRSTPSRDWERMILESYTVWRQLIRHSGGTVIGDAASGHLEFEPPSW